MIAFAFSLAACDRGNHADPASHAVPAPIASVARALGVDAADLEPGNPRDPPAPSGDLKAELDTFANIDACVKDHARMDALVGDALEAIGYDTFLRDACRVLDAAAARDTTRCRAIDASALRARCEATVAEIAGTPDACPWEITSRPTRGRAPACLAIASRDDRLCAGAADPLTRATCEATTKHDDAPCAALPLPQDHARCARDADRWRRATPADESGPEALVASGALQVDGLVAGKRLDVDLAPALARGVVLVERIDGVRFTVGPLTDAGPGFVASSPHVRATLALELLVPAGAKDARVERAELLAPGKPPLATPTAHSTLKAKLDKLERRRGGVVTLQIDGVLGDATATSRLHAELTTFVRDIVQAKDLLAADANAGMR